MTANEVQERLERWRTGRDPEALGELLKVQRDRAYATALRLVGNGPDAEDVVQESCLKMLSRTHGFDSPDAFRVAVYRAVVQCAFDLMRSRRRTRDREDRVGRDAKDGGAGMLSADKDAEQKEMRLLLRRAMEQLPEPEQAAVVLCYQQGLRLSEAAQVLDTPRQTLRDRLDKAMGRLRSEMKRSGAVVSMIVLTDLLRGEGQVAAPASLCQTLDGALEGRPCAELQAEPPAGGELMVANSTGGTMGGWLKAGLIASCIVVAGVLAFVVPPSEEPVVSKQTDEAEQLERSEGNTTKTHGTGQYENRSTERREDMKGGKLAGLALGVTMLAAPLASAGETGSVADILKQIRQHKKEKKEAAAKARAARTKASECYYGGEQGGQSRYRRSTQGQQNKKK